jgi:DNA-binding transcriptional MerR regulator
MYTIKQLADMSGVSVRTLHYYDEIGLLNPKDYQENGYREYGDEEALKLQQILFFRELGFSLDKIREIMEKPDFDLKNALLTHRALLEEKVERMYMLIETVDKTIKKLEGENEMTNGDLYKGFDEKKQKEYEKEIEDKYGQTEEGARMIRQSKERVAKMGKEGMANVQQELAEIHEEIASNMDKGYDSQEVQAAIARHRAWLNNFYDCSDEVHLGLGKMYVSDPRFAKSAFSAGNIRADRHTLPYFEFCDVFPHLDHVAR